MRTLWMIAIGFVVCSSYAIAEEKWTTYSNTDFVGAIAFTPGYMWIGTWGGGLVRWDIENKTYRKFTTIDGLGDNSVDYIYPDSSGNLWIGAYNSVTKFDGKRFEVFVAKNILADKWKDYKGKQIGRELHFWIAGRDKDGCLWFKAGKGLSKFTKQGWIYRDTNRVNLDSKHSTIWWRLEDSKGNVWKGTTRSGVRRFNGKEWITFDTSDGLPSNWVLALQEDNQGNIWVGTKKGCCRYDGKLWSTFKETRDLWINCFATDESGKLWAATGKGVCWWNGKNWRFLNYQPDDPLTDNWVITAAMDKQGNLWFGTGAGVCVFDGTRWRKYPLSTDRVNGILVLDSGEVWVGMRGGAGRLSKGVWTIFTSKNGLVNDHVLSVAKDLSGSFWFGTVAGLTRFDGKEWKTYTTSDGLAGNAVQSITIDAEGRLWCASKGISTFDGSKWKSYTHEDGLPDNLITSVAFDSQGILWFGSHGGGIGTFDGRQWKRITMENGLPDNFIYSVTPDDEGRIWVATENGGACVFKGKSWRTFTPKDGLASRYVRKVVIDKEGSVWFATGGGVSKLEGLRFPQ